MKGDSLLLCQLIRECPVSPSAVHSLTKASVHKAQKIATKTRHLSWAKHVSS